VSDEDSRNYSGGSQLHTPRIYLENEGERDFHCFFGGVQKQLGYFGYKGQLTTIPLLSLSENIRHF
jgi:hypothetical protein